MGRHSTRPGVGETIDDRMGDREPIREGEYEGVAYRIYRIQSRDGKGEVAPSHYTGYIQVPEVCEHQVDGNNLPHPPGHHGLNFGPSDDDWIGFGTMDARDHNYDSNMAPLPHDRREEPVFDGDTASHFSPDILEDAVIDWIEDVVEFVEEGSCIACDGDD